MCLKIGTQKCLSVSPKCNSPRSTREFRETAQTTRQARDFHETFARAPRDFLKTIIHHQRFGLLAELAPRWWVKTANRMIQREKNLSCVSQAVFLQAERQVERHKKD